MNDISVKLLELQGEEILTAGAWILTGATLIAAIGETILLFDEDNDRAEELVVLGKSAESAGNLIQGTARLKTFHADPSDAKMLSTIGCYMQAAGNASIAAGTQREIDTEEEEGVQEVIIGSSIQSIGAGLEAAGAAGEEPAPSQSLEVAGNVVISYGAGVEALGGLFFQQEKEEEARLLFFFGSWTQFIGAVMELIAVSLAADLLRGELLGEKESAYSYGRYMNR